MSHGEKVPQIAKRARDWPQSWVLGYDGRFFIDGAEVSNPRNLAPPNAVADFRRRRWQKATQNGGDAPAGPEWPAGALGWSFAELNRDDCVGLLAEDSGFLAIYINGHIMSRVYEGIIDNSCLFPLIELCGTAREVGLPPKPLGPGGEEEQEDRAEAKDQQADLVETLSMRALQPYADIYAAAIIAQECFQSAQIPSVPTRLVKLLMATQLWLQQGRPPVTEHNGMLSALTDWCEAAKDQASQRVKPLPSSIEDVIQRVFLHAGGGSSDVRIRTVHEFRTALNERMSCSHLSPEFLRSHMSKTIRVTRGRQTKILRSTAGGGGLSTQSVDRQEKDLVADEAAQDCEPIGSTLWDLTPWTLSASHVRRVLVVLQSPDSYHIGSVSIARLEPNVPDELQLRLAECFRGPTSAKGKKRRPEDMLGRGNLPVLVFHGHQLPADVCPAPLSSMAEANMAGMLLRFVRRMDMNQGLSRMNDGKLSQALAGHAAAAVVAGALCGNGALEELKASGQNFGDAGASDIGNSLIQGSRLQWLDLSSNSISELGACDLAKGLSSPVACLQHLDLANNNLGSPGCSYLAGMLKQNTTVRYLGLQRNYIGAEGAVAMAEALVQNFTLEELDLGRNSVGVAGAGALAAASRGNGVLRALNIQDNNLDVCAAMKIAEEFLSIDMSQVTPSTSRTLRMSHPSQGPSSALQALNFRHNNLGVGAVSMMSVLQVAPTNIVDLNLAWNNLGTEAASALVGMLGVSSSCIVEKLDLRDNPGFGLLGVLGRAMSRFATDTSGQPGGAKAPAPRRSVSTRRGVTTPQEVRPGVTGREAARHVRWLNLANCDLESEGASLMALGISAFSNLQELFLFNNRLLSLTTAELRLGERQGSKESATTRAEAGNTETLHT
ncbi:unnamed protein product, partial [Polarella glacialis]